ncbi:15810_t:CDS:2 [Dentiscutata heterogama]|uniref:15810_t:CDS:1 n=1 Tax=Dentiscutata heterogama TaxID=1316150 RepID=A0ACA9KTT9_9GLOM|nr:15810_t:CDS:2 [Dentiscutata heterogama]
MSLPLTYNGDDTKNEESAIIYNFDWSMTSLGPIDSWEPMIKNALNLCLQSTFPICLYLGPDYITIYNKAFQRQILLKDKYDIGKSAKEDLTDYFISQLETVKTKGEGFFVKEHYIERTRNGYKEEAYFNYTFSPIFKSDGSVYCIFNLVQDVTQKVLSTRRFKTISEFGCWTSG